MWRFLRKKGSTSNINNSASRRATELNLRSLRRKFNFQFKTIQNEQKNLKMKGNGSFSQKRSKDGDFAVILGEILSKN